MFYRFVVQLIKGLIFILNGKIDVQNKENLPENQRYILAAPHRSWLDPVYIAVAAFPHEFSTMAKMELFNNKFIAFLLRHMHAFPVNREKPGPSALKQPVSILKEGSRSILIFSSGTRYDDQVKGGTSAIARLSKAPIVPVVFQGPFTSGELLKRKKGHVRFGEPIYMPEGRISKEQSAAIDEQLAAAFQKLDADLNPNFTEDYKKNRA